MLCKLSRMINLLIKNSRQIVGIVMNIRDTIKAFALNPKVGGSIPPRPTNNTNIINNSDY